MLKKLVLIVVLMMFIVSPSWGMKLKDLDLDFGIQFRVMYNNSNIGCRDQYDFFRQRLRLNLDVRTEKGVGGFLQIEYRGGWGGASPAFSDPGDIYAVNVFNRLQARGIRYGYLYFPLGPGTVQAGLVPLDDQVDQMLFSADWDFNVGGINYLGKTGKIDYRLSYAKLVESVFYRDEAVKDKGQHLLLADLNADIGKVNFGLHVYGTYGHIITSEISSFERKQTWIGSHFTAMFDSTTLHGVFLANTGKEAEVSTNGWLARLNGSVKLGQVSVNLLGIYSSGKNEGEGFQTIQHLFGTGGYWAYTYIFTPNGPSDVNDYGLEVGNRGFGLITMQVKIAISITEKIKTEVVGGYFKSNKDMGETGKDLGTEFGLQFAFNLGKNMNIEIGGAVAKMGDAGRSFYQGNDRKTVNEIFTRLQFEF